MIEGSDRFGLAQLYQFRGRVGRGAHQSYAFLFTNSKNEDTLRRINALLEATNGFELGKACSIVSPACRIIAWIGQIAGQARNDWAHG